MKINGQEAVDLRLYRLDRNDGVTPAGRRVLPIHALETYEQPDASSRMKSTRVRCVKIGADYYRIEKEAGRPAVFLPPGVSLKKIEDTAIKPYKVPATRRKGTK